MLSIPLLVIKFNDHNLGKAYCSVLFCSRSNGSRGISSCPHLPIYPLTLSITNTIDSSQTKFLQQPFRERVNPYGATNNMHRFF